MNMFSVQMKIDQNFLQIFRNLKRFTYEFRLNKALHSNFQTAYFKGHTVSFWFPDWGLTPDCAVFNGFIFTSHLSCQYFG